MNFLELKKRIMESSPGLKKAFMNLAEEEAKIVINVSLDFFSEELAKSGSPVLKTVAGLLPLAKAPLLEAADKIDGEKG